MTGQKVLLIILMAFFVVALLLIYNGFYNPVSTGSVAVPAISQQN